MNTNILIKYKNIILLYFIILIIMTSGTFAYYNWKSNDTKVNIGIKDLTVEFISGPNVNVDNIGPVLDYHDGVIQTFKVTNGGDKLINFLVEFDINSISDNLLNKTFKYKLLKDNEGGTNYTEEVVEGEFSTFKVGTNKIISNASIDVGKSYSYQFIIYIDGNMKNDIAMQENSLEGSLVVNEFEVSYLKSFAFANDKSYFRSDTYREKIKNISFVDYIDTNNAVEEWDISESNDGSIIAWITNNETDGYYDLYIGSNSVIRGTQLRVYFCDMYYVDSISFDNLDTSETIGMAQMFSGTGYSSKIFTLDLGDKFDTSSVRNMNYMFQLIGYNSEVFTLNFGDKFDTSSVTGMNYMFNNTGYSNNNLILDLSTFTFDKVTGFNNMFNGFSRTKKIYVKNDADKQWILDKKFSGVTSSNVLVKG